MRVYIRADNWVINIGESRGNWQTVQTSVMGDTVNHPERSACGHLAPRWNRPGDLVAGLRTGDNFPAQIDTTHSPTRFSPTAPPTVFWQGQLAEDPTGRNLQVVVIAPSVWEWDSPTQSYSQENWRPEVQALFTELTPTLLRYMTPPRPAQPSPPAGILQWSYIVMGADHKGGTRPIGWANNHPFIPEPLPHYPPVRATIGTRTGTFDECVKVPFLILTASSARQAIAASRTSGIALFEVTLQDEHDHGDYALYLMLERIG